MQHSGKKFKRKSDGLIVTIDKDSTIHDSIYEYLNINDEWEEVKEPVDFMDALKSGKKVMIKHQDIDGELSYMSETYNDINDVMYNISNYFTAEGVREIFLNGEWYIEQGRRWRVIN